MQRSGEPAPGPRRLALFVLAVAGLAVIATSAPPPVAEARVTGDVGMEGQSPQSRVIRIHLNDQGGQQVSSGTLQVGLRSAADFGPAYTDAINLAIQDASGQPIPPAPGGSTTSIPLPVESCVAGCDLAYRLIFTPRDDLGPGATIRYEAIVRFVYGYSSSADSAGLVVQIEGQDGPTVLPIGWIGVLVGGALGTVAGVFAGRRLRLVGRARRVPAGIVIGALVVVGIWPLLILIVAIVSPQRLYESDLIWPYPGGFAAGLLAAALLLTLGTGLAIGLRRWPRDGGWLLGLAAVSTIALGSVWIAWMIGSFAVLQPAVLAVLVAIVGFLLGAIVGQTWGRAQGVMAGRRLWPSLVVTSQGFLATGLVYFALTGIEPTGLQDPTPISLVALVGVAIIAAGAWRWFRGSRWLMILANLVLSVIGVVGGFLYMSLVNGFGGSDSDAMPFLAFVYLEVAAAIVGLVASTQRYGAAGGPPPSPLGDAELPAIST